MAKKPRLQFNAQMAFALFYKNVWRTVPDMATPLEICRIYLLSRRYVNACFAGTQKPIVYNENRDSDEYYTCIFVDLSDREINIQPFWPDEHQIFGRLDWKLACSILRIAFIERLEVCIVGYVENQRMLSSFLELCKILDEKRELQKIHLYPHDLDIRLILDKMPKKIHRLEHTNINFSVAKRLSSPLDVLSVEATSSLLSYYHIFETPARHIQIISGDFPCQLTDLVKCGPFKPNAHLQILTMPIEVEPKKTEEEWHEESLPKYEVVFGYLKELNENLTVKSEKYNYYQADSVDYDGFLLFHQKIKHQIHSLINAATRLKIKLQVNEFGFNSDQRNPNLTRKLRKKIADLFLFKQSENFLTGAFEYRCHEYTKMPKKCLRPNAKQAFITHSLNENTKRHSVVEIIKRQFMTSPEFLNAFFNFTKCPVNITLNRQLIPQMHPMVLSVKWGDPHQASSVINSDLLIALLKLAKIERLMLTINSRHKLEQRFTSNFLSICRTLKEKDELREIILDASNSHLSFFLDVLPQKIARISAKQNLAAVHRIKSPLDKLTVGLYGDKFYYDSVLSAPARHIILENESKYGELYDLNLHGPFSPNPYLERIKMVVLFVLPREPEARERVENWPEKYLPKYEQSLKALKSINESVCLESKEWVHADLIFRDCPEFLFFHKHLLSNVHKFIELAARLNFKINLDRIEVRATFNRNRTSPEMMEDLADEMEMYLDYSKIYPRFKHEFEHNGCKFRIRYFIEFALSFNPM